MKIRPALLASAAAVAFSCGIAHADPAPAPAPTPPPGLSPDAAQQYQRAYDQWAAAPCGLSMQPNPIPHMMFKQCGPDGSPVR